jgi:hypothetical protein
MNGCGQIGAHVALPPGKEPPVRILYEGGWTLRAGVDDVEKRKILH